jgi:hypothetical protein
MYIYVLAFEPRDCHCHAAAVLMISNLMVPVYSDKPTNGRVQGRMKEKGDMGIRIAGGANT